MSRIKLVSTMVLTGFLAVCVTSAFATESKWEKKHPRRDQVNERIENQNKRIHNEVKEGELSKLQAAALHKDERQIHQEEHNMASQDGGHITKQEQKTLNQQENQVSKEIGK